VPEQAPSQIGRYRIVGVIRQWTVTLPPPLATGWLYRGRDDIVSRDAEPSGASGGAQPPRGRRPPSSSADLTPYRSSYRSIHPWNNPRLLNLQRRKGRTTSMSTLMYVRLKTALPYTFRLRLFCASALVCFCFTSPLEAASRTGDWFGTVTIWETDIREFSTSTQNGPDHTYSGKCSDTLKARVILQYCSRSFRVEEATYSHIYRGSSNGTRRRQWCSRGPRESWACDTLTIAKKDTKEEPRISGSLSVASTRNTYTLEVSGRMPGTHNVFQENTGKKGCSEEDRSLKTVTVPFTGAMDGLSSAEIRRWERVLGAGSSSGDPDTTILKPVVSGDIWPMMTVNATGRVSGERGNVIQDTKPLPPSQGPSVPPCRPCSFNGPDENPDRKPSRPQKVAIWFLTDDPCEYVKRELEGATRIRQTYEEMLGKAGSMDGKAFNDFVNAALNSDGFAPSAPMETNQDACIQKDGLDETKEKHYGCLPEVIFDADLAHENVHKATCDELNRTRGGQGAYADYLRDRRNYAADEINAYDKKIEILENWLAKNCR